MFVCPSGVSQGELELLWGKEPAFLGYGRGELGTYSLQAEVCLADRAAFPCVTLRVMRLHEPRVLDEPRPARVS